MPGAIDLFVNPNMSSSLEDRFMKYAAVKDFYFKGGDDFYKDLDYDTLLGQMDEAGVDHSLLSWHLDGGNPEKEWILDFSRKNPERFSLCPYINIDAGMDEIWALEDLVKNEHVSCARVICFLYEKPTTHAHYYPLYAKCCELDLPLSVFTGIPGPRADAASQDPLNLDVVCRDFPDLRLIMNHGADPWWGVAIRLMIKYPNLHMMTSAWMPQHLPDELVHFMNTRGQDKIMWASDHPVLDMRRCLNAVEALELRPGVREKYLYENARRVILGKRNPPR